MIPTILLGTAKIPNDGGELRLTERDGECAINLTGVHGELMASRMRSSEDALAELGCAHIQGLENTKVLVGGMGMGFTLAAALKAISLSSEVLVASEARSAQIFKNQIVCPTCRQQGHAEHTMSKLQNRV